MKAQLAQMPPEQRAQMEQMMPGLSGSDKKWTVEVVDTGKSDKVDGRNCRIWDVKRDGKLDDQICVVPYSDLPGKENFQADVREFREGVRGNGEIRPHDGGHDDQRVQCPVEGERFPGALPWLREGKLGDDEQVMKVWREETIPAAMFEIPAGYKQKQMPMGAN